MNYLAVGPYCWGKGLTREEAVRNAARNWPRNQYPKVKRPQDKHFSIYTSTGNFTVDGMGQISSTVADINKLQKSILAE